MLKIVKTVEKKEMIEQCVECFEKTKILAGNFSMIDWEEGARDDEALFEMFDHVLGKYVDLLQNIEQFILMIKESSP